MQDHQIQDERVGKIGQIAQKTDQTEQGNASLKLPTEIGIHNVHYIKAECDQLLALSGQVDLDASQVSRVDTAALQLLYALIKKLAEQDRTVVWLSPSETLRQAAASLGLVAMLGLRKC